MAFGGVYNDNRNKVWVEAVHSTIGYTFSVPIAFTWKQRGTLFGTCGADWKVKGQMAADSTSELKTV